MTTPRPALTLRERNEFVERLYPAVKRFCNKFAPGDADDLAQEVALVALRRADSFDPSDAGRPESWAFAIASHLMLRLRDKRRRQRTAAFSDVVADEDATFDPPARSTADASAELPQCVNRVRKVLAELPARDRRLIEARFQHGRSQLVIAARLGVTLPVAAAQQGEAMRKAKELLEGSR